MEELTAPSNSSQAILPVTVTLDHTETREIIESTSVSPIPTSVSPVLGDITAKSLDVSIFNEHPPQTPDVQSANISIAGAAGVVGERGVISSPGSDSIGGNGACAVSGEGTDADTESPHGDVHSDVSENTLSSVGPFAGVERAEDACLASTEAISTPTVVSAFPTLAFGTNAAASVISTASTGLEIQIDPSIGQNEVHVQSLVGATEALAAGALGEAESGLSAASSPIPALFQGEVGVTKPQRTVNFTPLVARAIPPHMQHFSRIHRPVSPNDSNAEPVSPHTPTAVGTPTHLSAWATPLTPANCPMCKEMQAMLVELRMQLTGTPIVRQTPIGTPIKSRDHACARCGRSSEPAKVTGFSNDAKELSVLEGRTAVLKGMAKELDKLLDSVETQPPFSLAPAFSRELSRRHAEKVIEAQI